MIQRGARCRTTVGPLGTLAHPDSSIFERDVVHRGTVATYFGMHQQIKGWHMLIAVAFDPDSPGEGRPLFVPAAESQFEVVAS